MTIHRRRRSNNPAAAAAAAAISSCLLASVTQLSAAWTVPVPHPTTSRTRTHHFGNVVAAEYRCRISPPPPLSTLGLVPSPPHPPHMTNAPSSLSMSQGKGKNARSPTDAFLDFMNEPLPALVDASDVTVPPELDDTAPLVRTVAAAADKRKAEGIVALRVSKVTATTSFLVFCSGNSRPQNNAIAASVMDDVAEAHGGRRTRGDCGPEGTADSGWILLDYGDVMVHIMTPKSRLFYDVEGQWRARGAEEMDLSDVLMPDRPMMDRTQADAGGRRAAFESGETNWGAQTGGPMSDLDEEDDPFWS